MAKGMTSGVRGIDKVMANLNRHIRKIGDYSEEGLAQVAIHIRRETETTAPITPLDVGNLRASWFNVITNKNTADTLGYGGQFKNDPKRPDSNIKAQLAARHKSIVSESKSTVNSSRNPMLIMGYTANYARGVHEAVGQNFHRPNSGAKWFEAALKRNKKQMLHILATTIKRKGV